MFTLPRKGSLSNIELVNKMIVRLTHAHAQRRSRRSELLIRVDIGLGLN